MDLSLHKFKKIGNCYLVPEDVFKELIEIYNTYFYLRQIDKKLKISKLEKEKHILKLNFWMFLKIKDYKI